MRTCLPCDGLAFAFAKALSVSFVGGEEEGDGGLGVVMRAGARVRGAGEFFAERAIGEQGVEGVGDMLGIAGGGGETTAAVIE